MPYNVQQISPIDFQPSVGVGVSLPFNGPACFNPTYTTQAAIRNNLINWFLTNRGERPLNPDFGGNLRQYIFEQIVEDNLDFLKEDIQSQLATYFPSVKISSLDVLAQEDYNTILVELKYTIQNTNINDEINLTFS